MRIVHTSDWHAGKVWKRIDRTEELSAVLENLATFIVDQQIDLVLVTGDVFDSAAPKAEAEREVFRFFRRIGAAGARSLVIAGNHDQPARIEAWGTLAELAGVTAVGRLREGVIEIETRSGERAVIGAIPFTSMSKLVESLELARDETAARQTYAAMFTAILDRIASSFRRDSVNLIAAHTDVDGALRSGTEREVHLGEDWSMAPQAIPPQAAYVALGHIHKPQPLIGAPAPARYAGSPMALDFGEAQDEKSFVYLEAKPGLPVRAELIPYKGARPLRDVRATLAELERDAEQLAGAGWLRVTVPLDAPDPEIGSKVRRLLDNAVVVHADLPEVTAGEEAPVRRGATPTQLFSSYLEAKNLPAAPAILAAFTALERQVVEEDA